MTSSTSLWYEAQRKVALRTKTLRAVGDGETVLEALYSGVSRGTERLVFNGKIPQSDWSRMRCPHQDGAFPFPVKYGYGLVGRRRGKNDRNPGNAAFCLHPHQSVALVGADDLVDVPDIVPARRAVLSANMETAVNVVWDSRISVGDRVVVVGAGVVGLLIAWVASRIAGTDVTVVDLDGGKGDVAGRLGLDFALPDAVQADFGSDVTINASGAAGGLRTALALAGPEARVVEASWHGDADVTLPLGGAFHSQRLQVISSQVGQLPADRRARWSHRRRIELAISMLADPVLDHLISHEIAFADAPDALPPLFDDPSALAIVLRYGAAEE